MDYQVIIHNCQGLSSMVFWGGIQGDFQEQGGLK